MARPSTLMGGVARAVGAIAVLLFLAAAASLISPSPAQAAPAVPWSPTRVISSVAQGSTKTVSASFSSMESLSNVSVWIGPTLAPYVSASPSSFAAIAAGGTVTLTLTISAPGNATVGTVDGTLHLRDGGGSNRTYARPLLVTVNVTANHPPVADAGPDQNSDARVGDAVLLNGSASSDPDGQPLTYSWSLIAVPGGSTAELPNPTSAKPSFIADRPGTYVARLIVNDGVVDSLADDVSIIVAEPPPTVRIASPENLSVVTASPVTVTGTVDDPNATIAVNGVHVANSNGNYTADVGLAEGSNIVTVIGQNGTGQGSASVEVLLHTTDHPALTITSPTRGFIVGEPVAMGAPFPDAAQVAVTGVIKVETSVLLGNKPGVTVNGVNADVSHRIFNLDCFELFPPFHCWDFEATIPLQQGDDIITAVGTDVLDRSTTVSIHGVVDFCRIGVYNSQASTPGQDPGVAALAGRNHEIQSNRCHEVDGCSAPGVTQRCADDPMMCPIGGIGTVVHDPFLAVPAFKNLAPTAFGKGGDPPTGFGNPPGEYFVHGRQSQFDLPCNHHDVCYQTCVPVAGLSDAERELAWEDAWHTCNEKQAREMLDVCLRAYGATCPYTILGGLPDPLACLRWRLEKGDCGGFAFVYFTGVESTSNPLGVSGLERFKQRQTDYCLSP